MTIASHTTSPDFGPLFVEPREPVPSGTCKHCGEEISRYYTNHLYRGWYHVASGKVDCPTNTGAEPQEGRDA